jgi:hypothetical protein
MAQLAKEQKLDIILDSNPVHNTQAKVDVTNTGTDVAPVDVPKKPAPAAKQKKVAK